MLFRNGLMGEWLNQRSAKPSTAVRIRFRPHQNSVRNHSNAVFLLICHTFVILRKVTVLFQFPREVRILVSYMTKKRTRCDLILLPYCQRLTIYYAKILIISLNFFIGTPIVLAVLHFLFNT